MTDENRKDSNMVGGPTPWPLVDGSEELLDDDFLDMGEEETPEIEAARARSRMQLRGAVFAAVTLVALWSVFGFPFGQSILLELNYYMNGGAQPTSVGDLRALRASGTTQLDAAHNSYVRLENQVMTYEAESNTYQYFFDPLFNIITRTKRELPAKDYYRSVTIPSELVWIIEQRRGFAEDLTAGFDGEGRLLRVDKAPRLRHLYDAYARTVSQPLPPEETWIFLEGDTPDSYWLYFAGCIVAGLLILMTGLFFALSYRTYRRIA